MEDGRAEPESRCVQRPGLSSPNSCPPRYSTRCLGVISSQDKDSVRISTVWGQHVQEEKGPFASQALWLLVETHFSSRPWRSTPAFFIPCRDVFATAFMHIYRQPCPDFFSSLGLYNALCQVQHPALPPGHQLQNFCGFAVAA